MSAKKTNKLYSERINDLEARQTDALKEALEEQKSFTNVMKTLSRLDRDKSNKFRLTKAQKAVIKENDIDSFKKYMQRKTRQKWDREVIPYAVISFNDKRQRKIQLPSNEEEREKLIYEKIQEVQSKLAESARAIAGIEIDPETIKVSVSIQEEKKERKFNGREVLVFLQRIDAAFHSMRKGKMNATIRNIKVACGITITDKDVKAA